MSDDKKVLVKIDHLTKHFPITRGIIIQRQVGAVQAVDQAAHAQRPRRAVDG